MSKMAKPWLPMIPGWLQPNVPVAQAIFASCCEENCMPAGSLRKSSRRSMSLWSKYANLGSATETQLPRSTSKLTTSPCIASTYPPALGAVPDALQDLKACWPWPVHQPTAALQSRRREERMRRLSRSGMVLVKAQSFLTKTTGLMMLNLSVAGTCVVLADQNLSVDSLLSVVDSLLSAVAFHHSIGRDFEYFDVINSSSSSATQEFIKQRYLEVKHKRVRIQGRGL